MPIKQTIPTNSSDSLQFGNATTPVAAQVTGAEVSTGNGYLAMSTTASGTVTERARIDVNGNVAIGTSSISNFGSNFRGLKVEGSDFGFIQASSANAACIVEMMGASVGFVGTRTNHPLVFRTFDTERMRIDSSGNLGVGTASLTANFKFTLDHSNQGGMVFNYNGTSTQQACRFVNGNGTVGHIDTSGTATSYVTSSDYRLKENIAPMTGALEKVALLKPVTYTWKVDGTSADGFIAHELAEVCPQAVSGEKDAVDDNGNPQYQGIDTSFLVATLTAAIQELSAKVTALEAQLAK